MCADSQRALPAFASVLSVCVELEGWTSRKRALSPLHVFCSLKVAGTAVLPLLFTDKLQKADEQWLQRAEVSFFKKKCFGCSSVLVQRAGPVSLDFCLSSHNISQLVEATK